MLLDSITFSSLTVLFLVAAGEEALKIVLYTISPNVRQRRLNIYPSGAGGDKNRANKATNK